MAHPDNTEHRDPSAEDDRPLSNIKAGYDQEKTIDEARQILTSLLDQQRYVGDLISMDYNTAEVLIHDRLRQDVGGVPHGCLLLATRIKPDAASLDLSDAQTSVILLRALKASSLPNDVEMKHARLHAGQRAAQTSDNWDESNKTDLLTLDQMRYAGAHCRILGTFRMNRLEDGEWNLEYGGDIDNFYAGQGMKVYKPAGEALERIANYTRFPNPDSIPVLIGKLRYAASIRDADAVEAVPIQMRPHDLVAQRTALFGMTRTGKSNTTKTIARAVFEMRTSGDGLRVGQLIFDPNGEYANQNPQDQGCLRNVANLDGVPSGDVVTYGLQPHPHDPGRKITKFNFFGDNLPQSQDASKQDWDEALHSLYQGKQLIDDALREEGAGYIKSFINANIEAPTDIDVINMNVRYRRALLVYKSVLAAAGFQCPDLGINTAGLFNDKLRKLMSEDADMGRYAKHMKSNSQMPWNMAQDFCRDLSNWVQGKAFKDFDKDYKADRKWSDRRFLDLLRIFEDSRGLAVLQSARQWHSLESKIDYAKDIVTHIREGRLVIFDQALGDPGMNEQAAARIMRSIFAAQQEDFVNPKEDQETGEVMKPPPVIVYVEEAHTLLPKGNETDTTNIWARVAKEGAKFNIGMVYSTQEPSTIQTNILKNTENWFIAHLNNTDETRQLEKYNDFSDFTDSIIKVNEVGFLRVRTLSSPYTLPVQINEFKAPVPSEES